MLEPQGSTPAQDRGHTAAGRVSRARGRSGGKITEGLLNKVEMACRAHDPCLGCATHSLPGHLPLRVSIYDRQRNLVQQLVLS